MFSGFTVPVDERLTLAQIVVVLGFLRPSREHVIEAKLEQKSAGGESGEPPNPPK